MSIRTSRLKNSLIFVHYSVNYYDREVRLEDENKTIGIVLCKDKSESVVEFT
ncbi:MAG: DUF1016 family protein, partial [Bacteroidetes bacterium]|nr:DUF1016 family protein [Bacteroidota bacterium]